VPVAVGADVAVPAGAAVVPVAVGADVVAPAGAAVVPVAVGADVVVPAGAAVVPAGVPLAVGAAVAPSRSSSVVGAGVLVGAGVPAGEMLGADVVPEDVGAVISVAVGPEVTGALVVLAVGANVTVDVGAAVTPQQTGYATENAEQTPLSVAYSARTGICEHCTVSLNEGMYTASSGLVTSQKSQELGGVVPSHSQNAAVSKYGNTSQLGYRTYHINAVLNSEHVRSPNKKTSLFGAPIAASPSHN